MCSVTTWTWTWTSTWTWTVLPNMNVHRLAIYLVAVCLWPLAAIFIDNLAPHRVLERSVHIQVHVEVEVQVGEVAK